MTRGTNLSDLEPLLHRLRRYALATFRHDGSSTVCCIWCSVAETIGRTSHQQNFLEAIQKLDPNLYDTEEYMSSEDNRDFGEFLKELIHDKK